MMKSSSTMLNVVSISLKGIADNKAFLLIGKYAQTMREVFFLHRLSVLYASNCVTLFCNF